MGKPRPRQLPDQIGMLQRVRMSCQACGGFWTGSIIVEIPLTVAAGIMRAAAHCPGCGAGSDKVAMGWPKSALPPEVTPG